MILADQFAFGILTNGAELVVHVRNCALNIGHRYDGVLIQSELVVCYFFGLSIGSGEALFHSVRGSLALRAAAGERRAEALR